MVTVTAIMAAHKIFQRQKDSQTTQTHSGAMRGELAEGCEKTLGKDETDNAEVIVVVYVVVVAFGGRLCKTLGKGAVGDHVLVVDTVIGGCSGDEGGGVEL